MVRGGANCFVSTGVVMVSGILEGGEEGKMRVGLKCRIGNIHHSKYGQERWAQTVSSVVKLASATASEQ